MHAQPPLTVREAADLLRVNEDTIRRMIATGQIAAARVGDAENGPWRIPRVSLDPWCGPAVSPAPDPFELDPRQAAILEARAHALAAGGGLSRERLAAIAGGHDLDPDTRPVISGHHHIDRGVRPADAPTGTVRPVHDSDGPTEPAVLQGTYREPASHPSQAYVPGHSPSGRNVPEVTSSVIATGVRHQPRREGHEAPPFDGDSFGAGKSALAERVLPADDPAAS